MGAYCCFVERLLNVGGEEGVLAYLDDLLINTNNSETHFNLLKLGFQAHREAGLK